MSLNYRAWGGTRISSASRAASIWRIIQRDPKSVVFRRNGTDLTAQTVRIEHDNTSRQVQSGISTIGVQGVKIYGVRNHPDDCVADLDIEVGDRFWLGQSETGPKSEYRVEQVIPLPGQIQALAERISE